MTEVAPLRDASTLTDEERHLIASLSLRWRRCPPCLARAARWCCTPLTACTPRHQDCQRPHYRPPGGSAGHRFRARQVAQCRRQPVEQLFLPHPGGLPAEVLVHHHQQPRGQTHRYAVREFQSGHAPWQPARHLCPARSAPAHGTETFASSVDDLVAQVIAKVDRDPGLGSSVRNKAIVHRLYDMGIFEIKDAAQLVAELLGISRHTVYLHIRNHKAELAEQQ